MEIFFTVYLIGDVKLCVRLFLDDIWNEFRPLVCISFVGSGLWGIQTMQMKMGKFAGGRARPHLELGMC